MLEKITHVKNPLTIIAIFAGLVEVSGTGVLPFLEIANQGIFVWFLMGFPSVLVGLFFITLNFNHTVLYSPGDYSDQANFMKLIKQLRSPTTNDLGDAVKPSAESSISLPKA